MYATWSLRSINSLGGGGGGGGVNVYQNQRERMDMKMIWEAGELKEVCLGMSSGKFDGAFAP